MKHIGDFIQSGLLGALGWDEQQEPEVQRFNINMGGPSPLVTYHSGNSYEISNRNSQPPQASSASFAPAMRNAVWNPGSGMAGPATVPAIWDTAQQEDYPILPVAAQETRGQTKEIPSYMVGRRLLNSQCAQIPYNEPGDWNNVGWDWNLRAEHQHFIGSNGSNFGFGPDGVFSELQKKSEEYSFDIPEIGEKKLRADLIDEARAIIEKQKDEIQDALNKANYQSHTTWDDANDLPRYKYNLFTNNCQDYVDEVIEVAQKLARRKGISLYID